MSDAKKPRKMIDYNAVAKDVVTGKKTFKRALLDAGGTEAQSKKGLKGMAAERPALMKAYKNEVAKQMKRLQMLGQAMNPDEQENFIVGTLVDVASSEKSKGSERVAAVTAMGKSKRVQLFAPDTAVNLFSLQVPVDWQGRYLTTETIDCEQIPSAVAQDTPALPAKFEPAVLTSGKVVVPDKLVPEPEPLPAVVEPPSPAIETFKDSDFETFSFGGNRHEAIRR